MAYPTELGILTCLMILAASLWIPYILGVNRHLPEGVNSFQHPYPGDGLPDWVLRANRAHVNLIEQGLPFAVIVLVLHVTGSFNAVTYWATIAFFWLRVAHAVGMITGLAQMPVRPLIFLGGWVCILVLASQLWL
jgi:uncharacterized MAPEG superfamily protein